MKRSVGFYQDVLGLPLKFESPGWTEFATEGATLALHVSEVSSAAEDDPHKVPAGRCRPGLGIANLDDFHSRMMERKGPLHARTQDGLWGPNRPVRRSRAARHSDK